MSKIFVSVLHRHYLLFVLSQHQEFTVADFTYLAINFVTVFKDNGIREIARTQPTIVAVLHGTKFTNNELLEHVLAAKAIGLFTIDFIAWCIIFNFKFEDDLIRIKSVCRSKDTYCHYLLHF